MGSLLLNKEAVGLYRDDGLAIICHSFGPKADKTCKQVEKIFQQHNLKVIADTNLVQTDFLDVVLTLNTGKFSPFRKPNDNHLYINIRSNHPPTITKHLPLMIEKRISQISCDESEFHKATPIYAQALQKKGYNVKLSFQQQPALGRERKRNRKRNIIWFNPPHNEQVKTNIGKSFFHLLKKYFPPEHRFHKICNKNVIKLSYYGYRTHTSYSDTYLFLPSRSLNCLFTVMTSLAYLCSLVLASLCFTRVQQYSVKFMIFISISFIFCFNVCFCF